MHRIEDVTIEFVKGFNDLEGYAVFVLRKGLRVPGPITKGDILKHGPGKKGWFLSTNLRRYCQLSGTIRTQELPYREAKEMVKAAINRRKRL